MPYRVGLVFVQQNESAMHTYIVISPPFWSSFLFRSPQKKSRVSYLYSIFSLVLYFIHSIRPGALFSGRKERSADTHTDGNMLETQEAPGKRPQRPQLGRYL